MDIKTTTKLRGKPTPLKTPPIAHMECRVTIEIKPPDPAAATKDAE